MNTLAAIAVSVVFAVGCDKGGGAGGASAAPPIAEKDGAEGLKALFEASAAACNAKEFARGKALTMSVIPTKDHLKKLFKDDAPAEVFDKMLEQYKSLPPDDAKVACVFTPGEGRTAITVHVSSVEDLIAYKDGTPASEEFPGGAKKLAEQFLKPGATFYEVEVTEPGKDSGTKFHMFFWDGAQWRMLGAVWRALKS